MHLLPLPRPCKDKILIVDDVPDNLEILARLLVRRGYEIQQAADGPSALVTVRDFKPDLILLDILMPEMSGYEVCDRLKADKQTCDIPVIFLSALSDTSDQIKAFESGGADYITKPFRAKLVIARIENQLQIQRLRRQLCLQNQQLQREVEERKKAEISALQASQAKSEFLANMSHEIRTPMNGVLGTADLLLHTPLNANQRDLVHTLTTSANNLLRLMNDILDLSKLEAGKMPIEIVAFDLRSCLEDVIQLLTSQAKEKGLTLTLSIDREVPSNLRGDPTRLRQIVLNLIGNAIKFTEAGAVTVVVSCQQPGEIYREEPDPYLYSKLSVRKVPPIKMLWGPDDNRKDILKNGQNSNLLTPTTAPQRAVMTGLPLSIRFEIHDTGIGIAADSQKQLFQKFSQVDNSITRRYGGTGLGLSICQRLVELMGGKIGVDSELGRGATFWFVVPFAVQSTQPPQPVRSQFNTPRASEFRRSRMPQNSRCDRKTAPSTDPLKVLIVDDAPINRKVVQRQLKQLGYVSKCAKHGQEALERLAQETYDIVLMDCQMPVMDGYQATQAIRQQEQGIDRHQIIIGLTAHAMKGDREKCLSVGMDEYISKPATLATLKQTIQQCFLVRS